MPSTLSEHSNPFLLDDLLPGVRHNRFLRSMKRAAEAILGLDDLAQGYEQLPATRSPEEFIRAAMNALNIDYTIEHGDLQRIPASGPLIIVANHPFGAIEGMLLLEILLRRRSDVRVIANSILKRVPELSESFIGVNPYDHSQARKRNIIPIRQGLRWLQQGGALLVFPAGDVSSIHLRRMRIEDGEWDRSAARLAQHSRASILPMYIEGRNSTIFHIAALLHARMKTILLPRQILNKRNQTIRIRIGKPIPHSRLATLGSDDAKMSFLRLRTYLLADQNLNPSPKTACKTPIIPAIDPALLAAEIAQLPESQKLDASGELEVWHAQATQIPWILQEIGRLREITFREVGEGTGMETDTDLYDTFYQHLFLWNPERREIAGAYRLGLTDKIIAQYGRTGLYTYSLFHYKRRFLDALGPAIELGRSFICIEYQRSFAPMMLLWKGIGRFVCRHPRYAVLFGPVSISMDYSDVSRNLMIEFLKQHSIDKDLARMVQPRTAWRRPRKLTSHTFSGLENIEQISCLLSELEPSEKGVPVLIRQYLKLGGRILCFNMDPDFSNVVDGLIFVDLRKTETKVLRKYMGKEGARTFLNAHAPTPEEKTG